MRHISRENAPLYEEEDFMRVSALVSVAIAVAFATPLAAADKKPLTAEDIWAIQRVGNPVVSPDGKTAAFTVSVYDMEADRSNADIWTVPLAGGPARHLTTNKASDTSPAWSPDGKRIAFVSKREDDKAAQLYVMPVDGGEPERLTDMPLSVSSPKWFPDGARIAFVSSVVAGQETLEATKKAVEAREKSKVKARVTENRLYRYWDHWLTDGEYPRIFVVDVATKKVTDLLPGSKRIFGLDEGSGSYDISPDGAWIAFEANSAPEPYRVWNPDIFLVPVSGGEPKNLTAGNPAEDKNPVFSPDGKSLAYGVEKKADGWPDQTRLAVLDLASGTTRVLTENFDNSAGGWSWTADGATLVFQSEVRGRGNLYAVSARGGAPREIFHGGTAAGARVTRDGRVVFASSTLSRPTDIAVTGLDGKGLRTLTNFNDALVAKLDFGPVEEMTFAGAGGEPVQMFVVFPPGFDPKKKYPLVQLIHGGPVGTFGDVFGYRWNPHAFAAPGYIVAMVNFHGSSSFGHAWIESILGAHPDKPFTDVMKATDFLIAKGYVDENRMAAAGGSYGGFLVDWIEGHTDRFKALVSHAGVYDLLGQSASDGTYGRQHSYGGYPWTNLENVEKWSPNRYAANFKTPMLVLHGERDFRVPVTQGLELYGVLTAKGVPARLVYYPDEHHWILKGQNSKHWYGEVLAWLGKYLK
jgi:dipeptidyl aminopeptidase/acylaminoacyl peptidase